MSNLLKSLLPLGMVALGIFTADTANAALITYTTSGVFGCNGIVGCSAVGNVATISGFTVTYNNQPVTSVNAAPVSSANFGEITVTGPSGGSVNLTNLLLSISILQSGPFIPAVSQSWTGIASGTVSVTAGGISSGFATICFVANNCPNGVEQITYTSVAGTTIYRIQTPQNTNPPPTNGYTVRATGTGNPLDPTSFQGSVTDAGVPEASTYMMMFSGLVGLGLLRRRSL